MADVSSTLIILLGAILIANFLTLMFVTKSLKYESYQPLSRVSTETFKKQYIIIVHKYTKSVKFD
jgi:hypothetical protein